MTCCAHAKALATIEGLRAAAETEKGRHGIRLHYARRAGDELEIRLANECWSYNSAKVAAYDTAAATIGAAERGEEPGGADLRAIEERLVGLLAEVRRLRVEDGS